MSTKARHEHAPAADIESLLGWFVDTHPQVTPEWLNTALWESIDKSLWRITPSVNHDQLRLYCHDPELGPVDVAQYGQEWIAPVYDALLLEFTHQEPLPYLEW